MKNRLFPSIFLLAALLFLPSLTLLGEDRHILEGEYERVKSDSLFLVGGDWLPFPDYSDRQGWDAMLGHSKGILVRAGEKYLDYQWQIVPATAYLAYERTGERKIMEDPVSDNRVALNSLMLAELAEGKGRFLDQLVNGVWQFCQMPSWVLSAHQPRQASKRSLPDVRYNLIDLVSCAVGAQIATIWHFFHESFDKIDPSISYFIQSELDKKIFQPYLDPEKYASNWWLGYVRQNNGLVNNWNPWCNSDVILTFLLAQTDQKLLDRAIAQSVESVDFFIDYVKTDGACEEGPAYWGHAAGKLYDYLQIMYDASYGRFSVFSDPQVKAMAEYVSRSYVGDGWVVNFADASARLTFETALLYNYGKAVSSEEMCSFAFYNLRNAKENRFDSPKPLVWKDVYRSLQSLRCQRELERGVDSLNNLCRDAASYKKCCDALRSSVPMTVWYPQTQFCYMRNNSGWFFAAKGGHNNESHNHNDVGTFILYIDSVPVFADAGVGTYTKQTFSEDRYSIWSMQTDWHNLPMINGTSQIFGREFCAKSVSYSGNTFSLEIDGAYGECAYCNSFVRSYSLTDRQLTLSDSFSLSKRVASNLWHFLVQGQVYLPGSSYDSKIVPSGKLIVENQGIAVQLEYPSRLKVSCQTKELTDPRLTAVWGTSLRRIELSDGDTSGLKSKVTFKITRIK